MKKIPLPAFSCLLLASLFTLSAASRGGESPPYPVNPASQPLIVARAHSAERVEAVLATRQMRAAVAANRDFSAAIPGVEARVGSFRSLLASLRQRHAESIWFCLLQSSLGRQTGAFGWTMDEPLPSFIQPEPQQSVRILAELGLDADGNHIVFHADGRNRTGAVVARDAETYAAIAGGSARSGGIWRTPLQAFLSSERGDVALLANGRPLSGLASIALGVDLRTVLARLNLAVPSWVAIDFFNTDGDLGVGLELGALFSKEPTFWRLTSGTALRMRRDTLVEMTFPAPDYLASLLRLDELPIYLANLDARQFIPHTATLSAWLNEEGKTAWSFAGLMTEGDKFSSQFRRLVALLESAAAPGTAITGVTREIAPTGEELVKIEGRNFSFVTGVAGISHGAVCWIVSGSPEDWPDAESFTMEHHPDAELVAMKASLAGEDRSRLLPILEARSFSRGMNSSMLDAILPETDAGHVRVTGNNLTLRSERGLIPFLVPALLDLID